MGMDSFDEMDRETLARDDGPGVDATPFLRKARANAIIVKLNKQLLILVGVDQGNRPGRLSPNGDGISG
jgi:hypothetical protein